MKCEVLQVLIFKAKTTLRETKEALKMNRDFYLKTFGIENEVVMKFRYKNLFECDDQLLTNNERQMKIKLEAQVHIRSIIKVLNAIRSFKKSFSGDFIADFY